MSEAVVAAVAEAHRRERAQVLATTALLTRDLGLAEDCTQDAIVLGQRQRLPVRRTRS